LKIMSLGEEMSAPTDLGEYAREAVGAKARVVEVEAKVTKAESSFAVEKEVSKKTKDAALRDFYELGEEAFG
jgi:hypothetical protein